MNAPDESSDWETRLNNLVTGMAEAGEIPPEEASNFRGILCVAKAGLGRPGFVSMLRNLMSDLGRLGCPERKKYMEVTLRKFETDVLLGDLIVGTVLAKKSKCQEGEENDT